MLSDWKASVFGSLQIDSQLLKHFFLLGHRYQAGHFLVVRDLT